MEIIKGKHNSKLLFVRNAESLNEFKKTVETYYNPDGASLIYIAEIILELFLALVREKGFKFYDTHTDKESSELYYIYARWDNGNMSNKMPPSSTAVGSIGGLVLDKEMKRVVLVKEKHGMPMYKVVTGMLERCEKLSEALQREVMEETSLKLDTSYAPRMLSGWYEIGFGTYIDDKSFVGQTANCYYCLAVRMQDNQEIKFDTDELEDARYFDIEKLLELYESNKDTKERYLQFEGVNVSVFTMKNLHKLIKGNPMQLVQRGNSESFI